MHPWQAFIDTQQRSENRGRDHMLLAPLPPTGVLRISGSDALKFLQGQSTCDVGQITREQSGLGAFCTPEGRVIANFRILQEGDDYLLMLATDLLESVVQRLRMFVLRSDVQVTAEELALFGITVADGQLPGEFGQLPITPNAAIQLKGVTWIRMPPPGIRWLISGPLEAAQRCWLQLIEEHQSTCQHAEFWRLQEIRSGIPWVSKALSEDFLPQMLNLDVLGAISFDKGCYTGQEIIARTHYRGQIKRRTYRGKVASRTQVEPGLKLLCREEIVGQIVNAAAASDGQEFLAVVRCDRAQNSEIILASEPEAPLQWMDLAYTLP